MFKPKYVKQGRQIVHGARKLLRYKRDLLSPEEIAESERLISELDDSVKSGAKDPIQNAVDAVEKHFKKVTPAGSSPKWRENCEVVLVAVAIAVGIRAYFLQPFKIPTGSMQPTLNGILVHRSDAPKPNVVKRVAERLWLGRNYVELVSAIDDNEVLSCGEVKRYGFFTYTMVQCRDGQHILHGPVAGLVETFGLNQNRRYAKGETIVRGYVDTGDQVFVDKLSYHFRNPKRGEVFVFNTKDVPTVENRRNPGGPSQFYIKRLAGIPGDKLRIAPPDLYINGVPGSESGFRRVMEAKDGYRGYSIMNPLFTHYDIWTNADQTVEVPAEKYVALGDNSFNSSDSRDWGFVPEGNLVGRGFLVYWPFNKHWGVIH